jgi:hypothetical protein
MGHWESGVARVEEGKDQEQCPQCFLSWGPVVPELKPNLYSSPARVSQTRSLLGFAPSTNAIWSDCSSFGNSVHSQSV